MRYTVRLNGITDSSWGTGMTGRPGYRTMDMHARSTVSYLVRTPRVPFFMHVPIGLEAKGFLAFQGLCSVSIIFELSMRSIADTD